MDRADSTNGAAAVLDTAAAPETNALTPTQVIANWDSEEITQFIRRKSANRIQTFVRKMKPNFMKPLTAAFLERFNFENLKIMR